MMVHASDEDAEQGGATMLQRPAFAWQAFPVRDWNAVPYGERGACRTELGIKNDIRLGGASTNNDDSANEERSR